jgi:hypothetical protein
MRRMMIPVVALSLVAVPFMAEAQTPRPERGMMGGMPGPMAAQGATANPAARVLEQREALALTSAQVRQLQQLEAQHEARTQPLIEQLQTMRPGLLGRGAPMARGAMQMTPEQREQMRQMTPEQREQMRGQMQERREQMRQMTPEQREQMRGQMQERREQMRQATPEQREQLRAQMQEQMKALREQRAAGIADPELRAQMQALQPLVEQLQQSHQQARSEVQAVLTAEQRVKLQELQVQRGAGMRQRMGDRPWGQQGPRRGGVQRQ